MELGHEPSNTAFRLHGARRGGPCRASRTRRLVGADLQGRTEHAAQRPDGRTDRKTVTGAPSPGRRGFGSSTPSSSKATASPSSSAGGLAGAASTTATSGRCRETRYPASCAQSGGGGRSPGSAETNAPSHRRHERLPGRPGKVIVPAATGSELRLQPSEFVLQHAGHPIDMRREDVRWAFDLRGRHVLRV